MWRTCQKTKKLSITLPVTASKVLNLPPFVEKLIQKDIEVSFFKGSVALDMVVKMICQEDYC